MSEERLQPNRDDIDSVWTWTLKRATHRVEREMSAWIAEWGLSPIQFGILAQLAAEGQMTVAELARACLVQPQSAAKVIDGMVAKGLLEREGARAKGRANPLRLSENGRSLIETAWPKFVTANDSSTFGLTSADRKRLNEILHRLRDP